MASGVFRTKEINMELSANWQKLKASLGAGAPTIQFPNLPERAPSCSKRKQPPTSTHSSGKKLRVNEPGMESEVIKEQINSGLCEKWVGLLLTLYTFIKNQPASRLANMLRSIVRWLALDQNLFGNQH